MKPTKQYVVNGNVVIEVFKINDEYMIYDPHYIKVNNSIIYDNKGDAMYAKLIVELASGKDIKNFKPSPYYKDYIKRLKIENPEYLI